MQGWGMALQPGNVIRAPHSSFLETSVTRAGQAVSGEEAWTKAEDLISQVTLLSSEHMRQLLQRLLEGTFGVFSGPPRCIWGFPPFCLSPVSIYLFYFSGATEKASFEPR